MKFFFLFITLFFSTALLSQKEGHIWYFGNGIGLNFSSPKPKVLKDGGINTYEGCATISDGTGKLLFYTNGVEVWAGNHKPMTNGKGLGGHISSTQSALIVPKPKSPNLYYIFTIDASENQLVGGLKYSIVDMKANGGLGDVIEKNVDLIKPTCEKITAVMHADSVNYWILTHGWDNNTFHAFLLSKDGVSKTAVKTNIGSPIKGEFKNGNGYLKASPKGNRLALTFHADNRVEIFKFNNKTGKVSSPVKLEKLNGMPYGLEFSSSGRRLYVSSLFGGEINQFDIGRYNNDKIKASRKVIRKKKKNRQTGALQLGVDGKIYISDLDENQMSVINKPNVIGKKCGFKANYIDLGEKSGRFGLPTFVQSFFVHQPIVRKIDVPIVIEKPVVKVEKPPVIIKKIAKLVEIRVLEKIYEDPNNPNSKVIGKTMLPDVDILLDHQILVKNIVQVTENQTYSFKATKAGYLTNSATWTVTKDKFEQIDEDIPVIEIVLDKIFVNKEITLEDIYFDFDKATLQERSKVVLDRLVKILLENPAINIQLSAHTDCRGRAAYNLSLSKERAKSVMNYLVEKGVNNIGLTSVGYGETIPAVNCANCQCEDDLHEKNRRVTFKIVK